MRLRFAMFPMDSYVVVYMNSCQKCRYNNIFRKQATRRISRTIVSDSMCNILQSDCLTRTLAQSFFSFMQDVLTPKRRSSAPPPPSPRARILEVCQQQEIQSFQSSINARYLCLSCDVQHALMANFFQMWRRKMANCQKKFYLYIFK